MKGKILLFSMTLLALVGSLIWADTTATAVVTFTISPIYNVSISGNPGSLITTVGNTSMDTSTTYAVTTNMPSQNITATVDSALPPGVMLSIELQEPTNGTSAGPVCVTTSPQVLVSNIGNVNESELLVTYTLVADITASPITSATRIITYTIGP